MDDSADYEEPKGDEDLSPEEALAIDLLLQAQTEAQEEPDPVRPDPDGDPDAEAETVEKALEVAEEGIAIAKAAQAVDEQYRTGQFSGVPVYGCPFCPLANMTSNKDIEVHVQAQHRKAARRAAQERKANA